MKNIAIISGGRESRLININECDFIIACDLGYKYCLKNNIKPNLIIGDFDSYDGKLPEDVETIVLPVMKDDTDTMFAYRKAIEQKAENIYLYCALGNRLDHSYANIQSAIFGAKAGITTYMIDDEELVIVSNKNEMIIERKEGYSLSVFAADKITGFCISGTKYEAKDVDITNDFPIGQSNSWIDDKAVIKTKSGIYIIICSKGK